MLPMGVENRVRNPQRRRTSTQVSSWGNFTPMALGADGWWDASDASTLTQSGSAVSQWNDKSGWGRNFVQATSANQPVTGSNTQNGLTTITFDGVDDGMTANGGANGKLLTSMFMVAKMITGGSTEDIPVVIGQAGNFQKNRSFYRFANATAIVWTDWGGTYQSTLTWDPAGSFHSFGWVQNSTTSMNISRDRSTTNHTSGTPVTTINSNNIDIGFQSSRNPTAPTNIAIGEVVLFYRTVTPQERNLLTDYFNAKWGLGI